mmetsp:Transcript_25782/g.33797  ORF Transcript_25782/g.33797 Transcript_25782/m.33797 type:complete len:245 (+) Transcript_25782:230-964(+)
MLVNQAFSLPLLMVVVGTLALSWRGHAFIPVKLHGSINGGNKIYSCLMMSADPIDRATWLKAVAVKASAVCLTSASLQHISPALAAMYSTDVKANSNQWQVSDPSKAELFFPQVLAGYQEIAKLDRDWDKIVIDKEDGDAIRRYLGTVGVSSPLFQINKAFNGIKDAVGNNPDKYEDIEVIDFVEASIEVLKHIQQADFLAYSQIFAGFGNGGGGTDYIAESRKQVHEALESYEEMLLCLNIKN